MSGKIKFKEKPLDANRYLPSYTDSFLSLPASPEYSMSETSLASLIRNIGSNVKEGDVYSKHNLGSESIRDGYERQWRDFATNKGIGYNVFQILKSPFPGQSLKGQSNILNLYPLIPQFAHISNSARFSGNPWNPANFIKGMIAAGTKGENEAHGIWKMLYTALGVTGDDDIWSNFLNEVFTLKHVPADFKWIYKELDYSKIRFFAINGAAFDKFSFPAKAFCEKIEQIISLKSQTTRKQWLSIVESFLRLSMATHLIWLCHVNTRLWDLILYGSSDVENESAESVSAYLFGSFKSFEIDTKCDAVFRRICGHYSEARVGINLFLHHFREYYHIEPPETFNNLDSVVHWINSVRPIVKSDHQLLKGEFLDVIGMNPEIQKGTSSFSRNMFFFLRHSLGQKATVESKDKSFDQCYWVVKKTGSINAPWIVKLGPVSVLMIVALSQRSNSGTATDISNLLGKFGIPLNPDKILDTSLGLSLVDLGLTIDNPDGEKGIVVFNPFYQKN